MAANDRVRGKVKPRHEATDPEDDPPAEPGGGIARWFLLGMLLVGVVCVVVGLLRHGLDWRSLLTAGGCLIMGIACLAVGLLELEWLERLIYYTDLVYNGCYAWLWFSRNDAILSDSDQLGRRGATVVWVVIGLAIFTWGCLTGLRII
jgi:hypothetical protein